MENELIKLIKKGKVLSCDKVKDIFEQDSIVSFNKPLTYEYLKEYAKKNEISDEVLHNSILIYGKSNLVLDSIRASKDFSKLYKTLKTNSDYAIKPDGFGYDAEAYSLFNLEGEVKPVKQPIKVKKTENNHKKLNDEEKRVLEENKKTLIYAIIKTGIDSRIDKIVEYLNKYGIDKPIAQIASNYVFDLYNNHSSKKIKNKESVYTLGDYYSSDYLRLYNAIFDEKNNPVLQMRLARTIAVFDNKHLKKMYARTFENISKRYFDYLLNVDLNTYNKKNYSTKLGDFIDNSFEELYGYGNKRYNNGVIEAWSHDVHHAYENAMFELMLNGRVQEYLKREYIDGRNSVQESWRIYYLRKNRKKVDWNAYYNSEAYKKLPVPKEALANGEEVKLKGKYPFFVVARNAMRRPNFDKKLLSDPQLYELGFHHDIFNDPYKLDKETLQAMKTNPESFQRDWDESLKEKQIYYLKSNQNNDKDGQKGWYLMLDKSKRYPDELELYVVGVFNKTNSSSLSDLYLYNKGCVASDKIKEMFFNGRESDSEAKKYTDFYSNSFHNALSNGDLKEVFSEVENISNSEMDEDKMDDLLDTNNDICYNYPPVNEEQAEAYEEYMYEIEQNMEAYESMTSYDWAQLDDEKSK